MALATAATAVAVLMVVPVIYLALRATDVADPLGLVASDRVRGLVFATLRLAVTVTAASLALGVGLAWALERVDLPVRRLLGVLAALPLVVPSYVAALALVAAVGPGGLLGELPGVIGFWGAAVALVLSTYPYVLLVSRAAIGAADPALEDAARASGDGRSRVFRRVVLPQLRPALAAGGLLTGLYVLSDFGAVAILRYDTLTRGIFLEYRSSFDRAPASVLGLVLVALTLVAILVERVARGPARPVRVHAGVAPALRRDVGRWRWPVALAVSLPGVVGVGVPVAVLAYWASSGSGRFEQSRVLARATGTSFGLAGAAAACAVLLSLPVALLAVRHRSVVSRVIETLAMAGYALPGLVVALALVFLTARSLPLLYQTLPLLVIAYVVRFLPEAFAALRASLAAVDPALEEAGLTLGSRRSKVARTVTLPLIRGGLMAGGALVFLTTMKELPATLLLRPAGADTLAVRVWTGASEGFYAQAAPAALVLLAVSAIALLPVWPTGAARTQP